MSKYVETLMLNSETVESLGEAYAGYATALSEQYSSDKLPVIASSFLISALFKSLINAPDEAKLFSSASTSFRELGWPIWRVCEICSVAHLNAQFVNNQQESGNWDAEEGFYIYLQQLLHTSDNKEKQLRDFSKQVEQNLKGARIQGLNIPYRIVIATMNEIENINEEINIHLENTSLLLSRLGEITELYQADRYHWQNLEGPILPFEPHALAIIIVLVKKWLLHHKFEDLLAGLKTLTPLQTLLIHIAYDLIKADSAM
ncbi:hypothetical protein AAHN97_16080 [Chitinophaga niabensis]|uniref:hypothetical protein n=1 Tax=Chitinophaga niabensis TaxID=536979 RepID=UPI0031BB2BA2